MIATIPIRANIRHEPDEARPKEIEGTGPRAVPNPERPPGGAPEVDWFDLVCRVQRNEARALEELYTLLSRGIKILIVRQLGRQEVDDRVHDTFLLVVQAIQRGDLREPDRLLAFARTIVRRRISQYIEKSAAARRDTLSGDAASYVAGTNDSPEQSAIKAQYGDLIAEVLRTMSRRDREVLSRFYLMEQSPEQICEEMGLTETQFRLLKSRAKAKFAEEGRRRTAKGGIRQFFLRKKTD